MIKQVVRSLFCLCLCLCFSVAVARDTYPRSAEFDAIHYRISVEIKESGDEIVGETRILFAINRDAVKAVALDFIGLTIDEVKEQESPARFERARGRLLIALAGSYRRGDSLLLTVKYHGKPGDGLYIKKNKFGDRSVFADNWPDRARHWFPSIDHPYDKATVEFFVTAPAGFDVVANGSLVETANKQNGLKLTHWRTSVPIPTYCMVIGATEFSIIRAGALEGLVSGVPIYYYLYPKDRDLGVRDYGRAREILEFYERLIGPYPYEKLALVESSTRFGGMENSSSIFFDEKAFNGSGRMEGVVAHEIAHQWFGDSVTEGDWHHLWLSEGFASYFENLFFERADGRDKFVGRMLADKEIYLRAYGKDPRPVYDPSITDLFELLNGNNYQKGGWVLHMLRHLMGDDKFFGGIRDYYRTYRDRNAVTADFERVMEFHAGQPLDWFFKQWIYEPGYPIYDASWRWDEAGGELRLRVTQKQEKTLFRMPLDVEIKVGETTRRESVQVRQRDHIFTFKLDRRPQSVAIDPDEWVLKVLTLGEEK